ncbi:zinc finger protein 184-like isoform X2 [Clupea harengus]|uniref:Zinc finger protein 184-like isoform X2 n=1 Tax=Clupea harengus TaxID=7950 RepID=A0A6P8EVC6_CLUHA|nr:zinc finger protein 184-like isoform X2 [Clupea harengus]
MMKTHEDFQPQFTSVMENLLHSAVSEMTKLFENAVQEMKAESFRMKKQNDNLKDDRCLDDNHIPQCKGNPFKRDIGIQCGVTPTLAERSSSPSQYGEYVKDIFSSLPQGLLQDGNQQIALLLIKQEDYTPKCLFPKLVGDQPKPFLVQQIQVPVMSQQADPSPSDKTTAPFTHNPSPSPPQSLQEPAPSASVETSQIQGFNPLDSLHASLDLMPDIQEEKPVMLLQPPTPISTDAADGSMSATPNEAATPKTEQVDCEIDQQSLRSHPVTHHDQPRRTSPRKSKSKYCCVEALETAQPQAKNLLQENDDDDATAQKRQVVVTLTHCDTSPKTSKTIAQRRLRHPGDGCVGRNQCEVCMRTLCSASSLQNHRMLHTGERPYACDRCDKSFPSVRGLNRHAQVHSAGRPHQCAQCGKTYVYQFNLTAHQLIHSSRKPHSCDVCSKRFMTKPELASHSRVHTNEKPYGCTLCGKKFRHLMTYNTHMRGHHRDMRYKCTTCGKGFVDPSNLKSHLRIHTGEKPYDCKVCGKRFTQTGHLKKHVMTQH